MDHSSQLGETQKAIDPRRWKPGTYKAKPMDWSVSKTKEGLPQVVVLFGYEQINPETGECEPRQLMWFGSFKGAAKERTLDTLCTLGLRGPISKMLEGRDGKALDENQEVQIVVEHRAFNGVTRAGIAWVNPLGGRGLQPSKIEQGEAVSLFSALDNEFMASLISKGLQPKSETAAAPTPAQGQMSYDDIPF